MPPFRRSNEDSPLTDATTNLLHVMESLLTSTADKSIPGIATVSTHNALGTNTLSHERNARIQVPPVLRQVDQVLAQRLEMPTPSREMAGWIVAVVDCLELPPLRPMINTWMVGDGLSYYTVRLEIVNPEETTTGGETHQRQIPAYVRTPAEADPRCCLCEYNRSFRTTTK